MEHYTDNKILLENGDELLQRIKGYPETFEEDNFAIKFTDIA